MPDFPLSVPWVRFALGKLSPDQHSHLLCQSDPCLTLRPTAGHGQGRPRSRQPFEPKTSLLCTSFGPQGGFRSPPLRDGLRLARGSYKTAELLGAQAHGPQTHAPRTTHQTVMQRPAPTHWGWNLELETTYTCSKEVTAVVSQGTTNVPRHPAHSQSSSHDDQSVRFFSAIA
jgi:hypothetical protein